MSNSQKVKVSCFLKEHGGRYPPSHQALTGLKRLNKIDFSGEIHLKDKPSKTGMIIVEPDSLVISGINVSKGAIAVYRGKDRITATIHYSSYAFDEKQLDIDYFIRFIKSPSFVQSLKDQVKGGIKTEIKPKHFLNLEIQLPDIQSQNKITAFFKRIENEMADLGNAISEQQSILNNLRQSILQEAIEGKLTAKWRAQHPALISGENHASKLLEKIKTEKQHLIHEGKIRKEKPLSMISNDEKPFDLPEGWVWVRLGEICENITNGDTPSTNEFKSEGEIPYLKVYNIVNQKIDFFYRPQYINREVHEQLNRSKVYPGDVIMNIVGPPLGKVAVVPNSFKEWNLNQAIAIFRCVIKAINPLIYINLLAGIEIKKIHTLGIVGQDNISLTQCKNIIFPLPPLSEQQVIVECVSGLMGIIDELGKQVVERQEQSEMLMQVVLREAFANAA